MTALSGTARTFLPLPVSISASAYISGLSRRSRVGEFDPHAHRARRRIEMRIDQRDLARESSLRRSCAREPSTGWPSRDGSEVALGDIDQRPNNRVVGDAKQHVAGHDPHALEDVTLKHNTVARRGPGEGDGDLPGALDLGQELRRHSVGSTVAGREPRP